VDDPAAEEASSDPASGVVRLAARGELDLATAPRLATTLAGHLAAGARTVCLDVSGLSFCGVSGLNALLRAHRNYEDAGSILILTGCDRQLLRHLHLTGLDGILRVVRAAAVRQYVDGAINSGAAG